MANHKDCPTSVEQSLIFLLAAVAVPLSFTKMFKDTAFAYISYLTPSSGTSLNIALVIGLFPGFMSMVAIYFILKTMGLTGSLWALILCNCAGAGTGFYVAKGFFDVIPDALIESARLDGGNNAQIFVHIILPMSKPIVIYQALMAFTGPWMDFIFAKVILGEEAANWTVSVGLYNSLFGAQTDGSTFSIFAAGCVCVAIPIVTLFMFLQKYYVEGVTAGSVK